MNEQEKSLKLAALMGWKLQDGTDFEYWSGMSKDLGWISNYHCQRLDPYTDLAQFAAILLKFPEVMHKITRHTGSYNSNMKFLGVQGRFIVEPTQANILNEILVMNGVEI